MITVTIVHSCFYVLLAIAVHCIYHWNGRLFLGGLGITALSAYAACWLVNVGWSPMAVLLVVWAGTALLVIGLGELLASSSGLVYAVSTFALGLSVVRLAGVQNWLTNGDAGVNSPYWSIAKRTGAYDQLTLIVALGSVLIGMALYEIMQRKGLFTYSQMFAESPLLTTSLGVATVRTTFPPHLLAGLMFALAATLCVFRFQSVQPSIFSASTTLVTLVIGFIVPRKGRWLLLAYGGILVTLRVTIQALSLEQATQLSAMIAGAIALLVVLRIWRIQMSPLKRRTSGRKAE